MFCLFLSGRKEDQLAIEELMLIENPIRRPKRRKRKMARNPNFTKEWLQGVDAMDAGAALGGLAASTMLPGMIFKETAATGTDKLLKLAVSLASTVGAGMVFRNIKRSAGQMAVAGGLAGTLTQALGMYTDVNIGRPQLSSGRASRPRSSPAQQSSNRRHLGESRMSPYSPEEAGVQVSVT